MQISRILRDTIERLRTVARVDLTPERDAGSPQPD
jgi:hypothetical protein